MILVIDNYDSFTYNLVQYIGDIKKDIVTKRNNETSLKNVKEINPSHIVISPGPGKPENAGNIVEVIQHFYQKVPILGVCLGHQAIGYAFGGEIVQAKKIMHGKVSNINHFGSKLFKGINDSFNATRYHSLIVDKASLPFCLKVIAETDNKTIMGLKHKTSNLYGVQFHPESIATKDGKAIIKNFLEI